MKNVIMILIFLLFTTVVIGQTNTYDVVTKPKKQPTERTSLKSDFAKQFPYVNPVDWKPGMRFMAEPVRDKISSSLSTINLSPYKSKNSQISKIKQADFQWKSFVYLGLEIRSVKCPRGRCERTYLVFDCEGEKFEFEYIGDTTELRKSAGLNSIDKLVFLEEVDALRASLVGKTLYIITNQWMKDDETGQGKFSLDNPKFVAVSVISVGLGSQDGPSKVVFKQVGTDTEFYLNIRLSGINKAYGVFGFDFDKVFQFDDPKLKYPSISDVVWSSIQAGKVSVGMTDQECELSWGKPSEKNKTMTGNDITEQWVYSLSSYLYFKNGILETIQK